MNILLRTLLCLALATSGVLGAERPGDKNGLAKNQVIGNFTYCTLNSVFSMYANNMMGATNLVTLTSSGWEWPKGSNKFAIYGDGLVYGGIYVSSNLQPRKFVNGATYSTGYSEGRILTPGTGVDDSTNGGNAVPEDRTLASVCVYRVRADVNPYTSSQSELEAKLQVDEVPLIQRFQSITSTELYNKYKADWDQWPWDQGAPWTDINGNGVYEPATDIPGIPGASQTLWHTSNDMNITAVAQFAGSKPVGLEFQRTIWEFSAPAAASSAIFYRTRIINKSGAVIDSMFVTQWSDPDLGSAGDDYAGCDTTRNLLFAYNGRATDNIYGSAPPAVGYRLLQGPIVPALPTDSALFGFHFRHGYRNLNISSSAVFVNTSGTYANPGEGNNPLYTTQWWNVMTGHSAVTGAPWVDNMTLVTKFVLAGDPVKDEGWLDGSFWPPDDRRMIMTTGPFAMMSGDTQEVVIASLIAQGADRLASITALRSTSDDLQWLNRSLYTSVSEGDVPIASELLQNYPNPFNPSTTIRYRLGTTERVTLRIYTVLGQLIRTLVADVQRPGEYAVQWDGLDGSGSRISSGVYFYRLNAGTFTSIKKLVIIR